MHTIGDGLDKGATTSMRDSSKLKGCILISGGNRGMVEGWLKGKARNDEPFGLKITLHIKSVKHISDFQLWRSFDDGSSGSILGVSD